MEYTDGVVPWITILLIASVYGLQVILFIVKREWQHIGWMFIYLLAMPVYTVILPLYSFWHFDDFSWGSTRVLKRDDGGEDCEEEDPFVPLCFAPGYEKAVSQ
jgi:chitin synthase